MTITVTVQAAVEPTEDEKKVERCILRLFPTAHVEKKIEENTTVNLVAHGSGLEFLTSLRNLIRQERIRNTARAIFLRNATDRLLRIYLNKQAAFMGRVSFCAPVGESPHGPVSITVESEGMQTVIDYLATNPAEGQNPESRRRG